MRSVDEMRALVHAEAARRDRRSRIVAGAAAMGAGLLVLALLVVAILLAPPATEVSTGAGPGPEEHGSSSVPAPEAPRSEVGSTDPDDTGAPDPAGAGTGGSGTDGTDGTGRTGRSTTGARRPGRATGATSAGGAAGSGDASAAPDPSDPSDGATGPVAPGPSRPGTPSTTPGAPGPPGTVGNLNDPNDPSDPPDPTEPTTTTTPTTAPDPRPCTDADLRVAGITWGSAVTGRPYPDRVAPAGEATWFVVSVWAHEGTPCVTADAQQELTVTDAHGTVVHRRTLDGGPGVRTEPGHWVVRDARVDWDPTCAQEAPDGWSIEVCLPVGPGSYSAQLRVVGTSAAPVDLTIDGP